MQTECVRVCIQIYHGSSCDRSKADQHTIEVASYVQSADGPSSRSAGAEPLISAYLGRYANRFLNEMPEFQQNTSFENMGEVFFAGLTEYLREQSMILTRLEIGETPLRQYIIYRRSE